MRESTVDSRQSTVPGSDRRRTRIAAGVGGALFGLLVVLMSGGAAAKKSGVEALLDGAKEGGADGSVIYRAPGQMVGRAQLVFFRTLIKVARSGNEAGLTAVALAAPALGFKVVKAEHEGRPVVVVLELAGMKRGAGAYVVRVGPVGSEAFVQAPHTFSDLGTRPLAVDLASELDARILGVSTVHRRGKSGAAGDTEETHDEDAPPPRGHADVAHDEESTFHIVTLAWLAEGTGAPLVQLHGYADRRAPAGAVLSAGRRGPAPAHINDVARALREAFPETDIAVFPDSSNVLGALTNAQARAASARGARFVHIELAASFRLAVRQEKKTARRLLAALASALRAPGSLDEPSDP